MNRMRIVSIFGLLLGLSSCLFTQRNKEDIAGTSVGTGNPGKVKVSFKEGDAPVSFSGLIEIYGSTQVPVPFYSPNPLASFSLAGPMEFSLTPDHFAPIPDTAWPRTSVIGDSLYNFNIIVRGNEVGAILAGFTYNSRSRTFEGARDSLQNPKAGNPVETTAHLLPLQPLKSFIPPRKMPPEYYNFLFIYGTGFFSESDSGHFLLPSVPKGRYELSYISLPGKGASTVTGQDSTYTYRMIPAVSTDSEETISDSGIIEKLRLPEELIHK